MVPPPKSSKSSSKPQGRDIRGFFSGGSGASSTPPAKTSSGKLATNGSVRSKAIIISDDEDVSRAPNGSRTKSVNMKPKSERVMEDDDLVPPSKPSLKRKKPSALISSDEEDEAKPSPPRKKVAVDSVRPKAQPKPNAKVASVRKTPATATTNIRKKKKADDDFIVSDGDESAVDDDDDDDEPITRPSNGRRNPIVGGTKLASKLPAKSAAKPSTVVNPSRGGNTTQLVASDNQPKPKTNWATKAAKLAAGPSAPGSKSVPTPQDPNCLAGLCFVFTGELSAFSRDEAVDLAKRFGGRVVGQPSSKTDYVVLGSDAGPSKLAAIKKHQLTTLDEDGFLQLIVTRVPDNNDPKLKKKIEKERQVIKQAAQELEKQEKKAAQDHATAVPLNSQLWTDRYAPRNLKEICGNKGQVEKLQLWLHDWASSLKSGFKKPGKNGMNTSRAVLITGPPGIGKTTSAHLCAKLEGFTPIELNASDARSKKLIENSANISNTSLDGWMFGSQATNASGVAITDKSCLIMDEVDGMSAGDRGGVGALVALIKKTKIPIICIANDRGAQKLKPLTANTYNLTFRRPEANVIRSRLLTIAFKEKLKIPANVIDQLVAGSQSDIRQVLNMLSTWKLSNSAMNFDEGKELAKMNEKYSVMSPFDVTYKMLGPYLFSATARETLNEKLELYFHDPSFMPLFIQENYLKTEPAKVKHDIGPEKTLKLLHLMDKAASSISDGDLVDALIHGPEQHWALMPLHAVCSTVRPASFLYGSGGGYGSQTPICFPSWLGQNSKQNKLNRQLMDIQARMRLKISGDKQELRQHYIPSLFPHIVKPLMDEGVSAIDQVIETMDDYFVNREDWDTIVELGVDDHRDVHVLKKISTATKTSFTRKYNTNDHPVAFHKAIDLGRAAKKIAAGPAPDLEEAFEVDEEVPEDTEIKDAEDDSDISHDSLIKAPKVAGATKGKGKARPKPKK